MTTALDKLRSQIPTARNTVFNICVSCFTDRDMADFPGETTLEETYIYNCIFYTYK